MRYPQLLKVGDTIGITVPSSGVQKQQHSRLDQAIKNVTALGYKVIETPSVRLTHKAVSNSPQIRVQELFSLLENPDVKAIIPPWGGEFLMEILPYIDFEKVKDLAPKWICGYSDISTLLFVLTVKYDIATVHGSNFMNMGYQTIHETDLNAFQVMSNQQTTQKSYPNYGTYTGYDISQEIYTLPHENKWKSLANQSHDEFSGRIIGGCIDTLCKLIGTPYAPVDQFIQKYQQDGFIWTLESCEMSAGDIYRTLWQMRQAGWFSHCNGIIYGRADGYSDTDGFTLVDALSNIFADLAVPVIYDADIGHVPPQIQIVNGAIAHVIVENGKAVIQQELS